MVIRRSKLICTGTLSENNHAFLHGCPTTVPGSWVNSKTSCMQDGCDSINNKYAFCAAERQERRLVASSSDDARFNEECFMTAPAIFLHNDIEYLVGKERARR